MSTKELIEKCILAEEDAWCNGDVEALDGVYDPDIVLHVYPFPDVKGLQACKQRILDRRPAYSNIHFEFKERFIEGNNGAIRYTMFVKHTGTSPSFPVPPTGKELVLNGCVILRIKNDKIIEQFEYDDYLGVYQQLGILSPPGGK